MAHNKTYADYGITISTSARSGKVYAICPECSPKRKKKGVKCLEVNLDKEYWKCHHCSWWGYLARGTEGKSRPNWDIKPAEYIRPVLKTKSQKLSDDVLKFFEKRKISKETVEAWGITWEEDVWFPQNEDFEQAICFPFYRNGELINVKYRGPKKIFRLAKDAERIFFGLDMLQTDQGFAESAIICEGECDAMALYEAGFHHVVSVPNGAPSALTKDYEGALGFIGADIETLNKINQFYIAVDNDEPGKLLEAALIRRLGPEKCLRVQWQEGCKDANDVLMKYGVAGVKESLAKAKHTPIEGVYTADDFRPAVFALYEKGLKAGHSLGYSGLTIRETGKELYTVATPSLNIFTGYYGSGKSEFLENIEYLMAVNEGWRWAVFNPETQPPELAIANLAEKFVGQPFSIGSHNRMDIPTLAEAMEFVDEHFKFILAKEGNFTLDDVLKTTQVLIKRYGVKGLVIDPWNNLEFSRPHGVLISEYLGQSLRKLNIFKARYDLWIGVVAHPNKPVKEKNGSYPVPTLYELNGGSMWGNMADFGITVHRDKGDENSLVEIHVQKVKFKHLGRLGVGHVAFDLPTGRYYDGKDEYGNVVYADPVALSKRQKTFHRKKPDNPGQMEWMQK